MDDVDRAWLMDDERVVAGLARQTLHGLELRAATAASPDLAQRMRRALGAIPRWLHRELTGLFREHWDVGLFDVTFGALKAFGAYPALYFAGLAWTIPLMETSLLNTQLWTAAYLVLRRQLRSVVGGRRYGVSLERLDELRELRLGWRPGDARIHRFRWQGHTHCVRVRTSRLADWFCRLRRRPPAPGVVSQARLRRMLGDPELRHLAEPLRLNPYLYEQVLLARVLSRPGEREALLGVAVREPPRTAEAESLRLAMGEGRAATGARLQAQRAGLAAALRSLPAPVAASPAAICLRALRSSLARRAARALRELDSLEYALLADLYHGAALASSPALRDLVRARERLAAQLARIDWLVARASGLRCPADASGLARRVLEETRAAGVPARQAALLVRLLCRAGGGRAPQPALAGVR